MKYLAFNESWNSSIKALYEYDQLEIFQPITRKMRHYQLPYLNRREMVLTFFKKNCSHVKSVIDVGAAQGNFSLSLAEEGYRVTWNDIRFEIVDYVKEKYEFGEINFLTGNIFDLDSENKFDCVLITEIIEHVAHPDLFLARCKELLSPQGLIIMTTPNGKYFRNKLPKFSECSDPSFYESIQFKPDSDGHIFLLHPDEIYKLALSCNLRVSEFNFFNNFISSGHLKTRYIFKIFPNAFISFLEVISRKLPPIFSAKIHAQAFVVLNQKS